MLWGNGRSAATTFAGSGGDKMALSFWEEDVTAPAAKKIKLRVINTTSAPIDVYAYTGATAPATPTWAAVPAYSRSTYVEVDSGSYSYLTRNAGTATSLVAASTALPGTVPTCSGRPSTEYTAANPSGCPLGQPADIEALPGTKVAGSAITGIIFPPSVAGSRAAQFTAAGIAFTWDKRPPRLCDPYC
jgi:hypothetical protein